MHVIKASRLRGGQVLQGVLGASSLLLLVNVATLDSVRAEAAPAGALWLAGGTAGSGSTRPAPAKTAEWQTVFAGEKWYVDQAGTESVFVGVLEAVAQRGEVSSLMRNSYYKMGKRTLFTGGKPLALLDSLVGKTVQIRGKAVDMELEGQQLHELWPGAVCTTG